MFGLDRHRNRVQFFKFIDECAEVGKAGNTFAFEFVLPRHGLDDLADNLSQPPQRMGLLKSDRISSFLQEVAAFIDQGLQVKFPRTACRVGRPGKHPTPSWCSVADPGMR